MSFDLAQKIADAVLYEGYLLYPYRRSAAKNQMRWQFGVLVPPRFSEITGSDSWSLQTECLVEPGVVPTLDFKIRFLQLQARIVEEALDAQSSVYRPVEKLDIGGRQFVTWEEAVAEEWQKTGTNLRELISCPQEFSVSIPGGEDIEILRGEHKQIDGRIVRQRWPVNALIRLSAESLGRGIKIRLGVENRSEWPYGLQADRNLALRHSLIAAHSLLSIRDGSFLSLIDPPEWARSSAAGCVNVHTWPVLVGEKGRPNVVLSAPIILGDYPAVAPESPGDLFDLTEIDELLTLRTMMLTDKEKKEAAETDPRVAALLHRIHGLPQEALARLHGKVRYFEQAGEEKGCEAPLSLAPVDEAVSSDLDQLLIGGTNVAKGSQVRLRPGTRRADAQDMFFSGRVATVEAVLSDLEGKCYLAVTLDDDPAAELQRWRGRFLYFYPDEIEPVGAAMQDSPGKES